MIISKLNAENFIYYNLHSEEVITSNFIEENNNGIFCDRLQSITIERVIDDIEKSGKVQLNIAFDLKHIEGEQPNINRYFTQLKKEGFKIALLNITEELIVKFGFDSMNNSNNVRTDILFFDKGTLKPRKKTGFKKFYLFEDSSINFFEDGFKIDGLFEKEFIKELKPYIEKHGEPHTSSYVYLDSYINIKKFISEQKALCIYSIYKLSLKILKEWRENGPIPFYGEGNLQEYNPPILVCQSLNSSYITSILSNLLKLDILILDKIGPINRIYNSLNKNIIENRNYIVVSDLVCLGTEVKIVKNIIEFLGGKYLGNVSLIKTETLKKKDINRRDATIAIFSIDRDNNEELGYYISTNLKSKKEDNE
ncbi:hypothetical protein [Cloacibacterium normanense]|uniref:Uncharacterized protein n=1 Tax=Cloacibacterium normanense TaxID=237258 RepID=A0A1E5UEK5_9FLAO|nr:hypothetical protein [Cloacibacterium normanense]AZI69769.1 hypothetical protein EB819_07705 [Cloacibacterium normanense]OEL11095.1 hypothetical protein BHF72_2449 [Cloacibacterium normanense]SDO87576.1 hypothetical protein SAMN04489756_12418 [Cloacibacterium normanense]